MEEQNYNNEIKKLRSEREIKRDEMHQMTLNMESMLNSLAIDKGNQMISWADMKKISVGVRFYVNKDVYFIKTKEESHKMIFKVYLNAGGEFGLQEHDCIEELYVMKGDLIDAENSKKVYGIGETKIWRPNELHKPICTVESIWRATKIKTYETNN